MKKLVLVTGGGGFLGTRICKMLVDRGYKVRSFSRRAYPHLESIGVECFCGDLKDSAAVTKAVKGVNAVIHTAAKAGIWGEPSSFYNANVVGTKNLLEAVSRYEIKSLVYTSSPSIVFDGKDLNGCGGNTPIPKRHLACYPKTKAKAEKMVLSANGKEGLLTVSIRPHLIWGPGDPHILPRLYARAKKGKLFQIGGGQNKVDVTYVDNAALAHIQALENLKSGAPLCGKAYFIGQDRPVLLWNFIDELLKSKNLKWQRRVIPYKVAYACGAIGEFFYRKMNRFDEDPPITRFSAFSLAKSHYFDHSTAKRDFGYQAKVSTERGLDLLRRENEHICLV